MRTPIYKAYKDLKWVRRKLIWEPWKGKVIQAISDLGVAVGVVGPINYKTPEIRDVECSKMIIDDFLTMYFDEKETLLTHDSEKLSKEGDVVLIEKLKIPYAKDVRFGLKEVIYQFGNMIDPMSGRKIQGTKYCDDDNQIRIVHDIISKTQEDDFKKRGFKMPPIHFIN